MDASIPDLDLRRGTADDADAIADAHRDSIEELGSQHYTRNMVQEWAGVVRPELYLQAMGRGEVFFVATGTVSGRSVVLGFSSDYVIDGGQHGTSAYLGRVAARQRIGSRLLALAEAFGRARGASSFEIEAALGAVEFYKRHGFVETEPGTVVLPSGFRMPCVLMRKELQ